MTSWLYPRHLYVSSKHLFMSSMSAKTQHISTLPPRPRLQSRSESLNLCVVARCQLSPAVENPNSAPAVRANVHRLSRSWLNHDSIFFRRFVFLHRIRDVGVRVCCRRLCSPIVSTGRRFPLIASCLCCIHYRFCIPISWSGVAASLCLVPNVLMFSAVRRNADHASCGWSLVIAWCRVFYLLSLSVKVIFCLPRDPHNRNCDEISPSSKATSSPRRDSKTETWFPWSSFLYLHKCVRTLGRIIERLIDFMYHER